MSHYDYVEKHSKEFSKLMKCEQWEVEDLLTCDGDKCYCYKKTWENNGISFNKGVMIYLLGKIPPYSNLCRNTINGFVSPSDFVIKIYNEYKHILDKFPD